MFADGKLHGLSFASCRVVFVSLVDALVSHGNGGVEAGQELGSIAVVEARSKLGVEVGGDRLGVSSVV